MKNRSVFIALVLFAFFLTGEGIARFGLGLGDPPLSEGSSDMDYIFKANQRCRRFGNRIWYNNVSMRMDIDVGRAYSGKRLFVVGDSVVNGGALTDQDDLATAILQRELLGWQVCNVSAGSWGPGNCAAYFKRYPWLVRKGDVLVLQVNGHDLWEDDPAVSAGRGVGVDVSFPSEKPLCALCDGWSRYVWPKLRSRFVRTRLVRKIDVSKTWEDLKEPIVKYNLDCCEYLYGLPFAEKFLLVFRSRAEAKGALCSKGEAAFVAHAQAHGVKIVYSNLDGNADYRDAIHPNEKGQRKMAELIRSQLSND